MKRNGRDVSFSTADVPPTVLVSHHADRNSLANATVVAPLRFRAVPSIAYRLALVSVGEARAAVSLNGPVGWDYAGGHALILGAGMDLYDKAGEPIRYDRIGNSSCSGRCFGGPQSLARQLAEREWRSVLVRRDETPEPYTICWPKRGCSLDDSGLLSRAHGCILGQLAGAKNCKQVFSVLKKPGQGVFAFMLDLDRTVSELRHRVKEARAA